MHVVIVLFRVKPQHVRAFVERVMRQAQDSLVLEAGCRRFDVCTDTTDSTRLCLYEIYDDRAAFDLHLASDHFRAFDEATRDWVETKTVEQWLLEAGGHDTDWLAQ